jgi:hypothetical protein
LISSSKSGNKIQRDLDTTNVQDDRSNQGQEKDESQRSSRKNQFISEMKESARNKPKKETVRSESAGTGRMSVKEKELKRELDVMKM